MSEDILSDLQMEIIKIFFPKMVAAQAHISGKNKRFVHYTSAEAALNILKTGEVWLRNTMTMNDYTEVQHGLDCLIDAYKSEYGLAFRSILDELHPDITKEIENHFNGWSPKFKFETFIFCISEHEDEEDAFGRLSMWRAYGGDAGVALVLNNYPFISEADNFTAVTSKVEYANSGDFEGELWKMKEGIEKKRELIKALPREELIRLVFEAFKYAALSSKHQGFKEEQEWRVIYTPYIEASPYIRKEVKVIKGIPQEVQIIKLQNIPEINFLGVEIPELINRIIIGPSNASYAISKAFIKTLEDCGVKNAAERVFISWIPLRN